MDSNSNNRKRTNEEEYRELVFGASLDELPELLQELKDSIIPDCRQSLSGILQNGLKLLDVDENVPLRFDDFQAKYLKSVHRISCLQHRFANEGLLTEENYTIYEENMAVKYLLDFAKIQEIMHYWEAAIRSLWNCKKAADPQYDSTQNTDVGLSRFRPVSWDDVTSLNNVILYLLGGLIERGWRRQGDYCMERMYTQEGYDTHAWNQKMTIKEYALMMTQKDKNFEQWKNITTPYTNLRNAVEHLSETPDMHFSTLKKDRNYYSFQDGIYQTRVFDNAKGQWVDRWYPHKPESERSVEGEFISRDVDPTITSCKYFEDCLNFDDSIANTKDWYDIETPFFHSILTHQKFPPEACRWMYILCGRLLHEVNSLDSWQVMPYLYGQAGTGKSTIITQVCKKFYHPEDVGVIANGFEKQFGLSAIQDKLLFIAPEIKSDMKMEQCDFQTIISGEDTSISEKFKTAKNRVWTVPGIMAGNDVPGYQDNQGSISRRLVIFDFNQKVHVSNPQLKYRVEEELPLLIVKFNRAYLEAVNQFGGKDLWSKGILPNYFVDTQRSIAEKINSLIHFLNNSTKLVFGPDHYVSKAIMMRTLNAYLQENNLRKGPLHTDCMKQPFADRHVHIVREKRIDPHDPMKKQKLTQWFVGVKIVEEDDCDELDN